MPIVDGYVFLHGFGKFPLIVRNKCKIVVLSSSDNQQEIEKILKENYVVDFISKPILEQQLVVIQKKWNDLEQIFNTFIEYLFEDGFLIELANKIGTHNPSTKLLFVCGISVAHT